MPTTFSEIACYFKKMQPHDTCMIQISDKGSIKDIPKLLSEQGFQFNLKQINAAITQIDIITG